MVKATDSNFLISVSFVSAGSNPAGVEFLLSHSPADGYYRLQTFFGNLYVRRGDLGRVRERSWGGWCGLFAGEKSPRQSNKQKHYLI